MTSMRPVRTFASALAFVAAIGASGWAAEVYPPAVAGVARASTPRPRNTATRRPPFA